MRALCRTLAVSAPLATALAVLISASPALSAHPRLTTLYTFSGADGNTPSDIAIGPRGVLYGTTLYGGTGSTCNAGAGCGTVFSLTPPANPGSAWTETVIHDFTGVPGDGAYPQSVVMGNGGVIFGVTSEGGTAGYGTVFSLTPPAAPGGPWTETVLYNFAGGSDAATPSARLLIGSGGVLYGATCCGGAYGQGAVYSLTPPSSAGGPWAEAVLFSFAVGGFNASPSLAIDDHGVLYGATAAGGTGTACWDGCGTVFSLAPSGPNGAWQETVLHNFTGGSGEGESPTGFLMGRLGVIYGVTFAGGTSDQGTVFSLTPPASPGESWTQTVLFNYPQFDGGHWNLGPGPLVLSPESGVFYGVTTYGADWGGTAFSLTPPASPGGSWAYSLLAAFDRGDYGAFPTTLVGSNGLLYGTTAAGPASSVGTVFSLEP